MRFKTFHVPSLFVRQLAVGHAVTEPRAIVHRSCPRRGPQPKMRFFAHVTKQTQTHIKKQNKNTHTHKKQAARGPRQKL